MKHIAREIIAVARMLAVDHNAESGLTPDQLDDLKRNAKKWYKQAISKLMRSPGSLTFNAEMRIRSVKYDGKYPFSYKLSDIPDLDRLDPRKVDVAFDAKSVDDGRLGKETFDVRKAISKWTDADAKSLTDRNMHMLYFVFQDVYRDVLPNATADSAAIEVPAVMKTKYGTFKVRDVGRIYSMSSDYEEMGVRVGPMASWGTYMGKYALKNPKVMQVVLDELKKEFQKEIQKGIQRANNTKKVKILEENTPRTYRDIGHYGGNTVDAYDFIVTGKGGTVSIGQTRDITNESRHWVEGEDYDILLTAKPARSNDLNDLFDDNRFKVNLSQGRSFSHEV